MLLSAVAYSFAFHVDHVLGFFWVALSFLLQFLGLGLLLAGVHFTIVNQSLASPSSHGVVQGVEFLYCFDVHCNAFLPSFMLSHVLQFLLLPLVLGSSSLSLLLANSLYAASLLLYLFHTHLGFRSLPLSSASSHKFLWLPSLVVLFLLLLSVVLALFFGFKWNASRIVAAIVFS